MTADATLQEMAAVCLDESSGDRRRAAELLYSRLDDNQKTQLLERYLDKAIWDLVKKAGRSTSRSTVSASSTNGGPLNTVHTESNAGLLRLARANLDNLLDGYRLSSGIALGNANRTELLEEATLEHGQASAHLERCLFLRAVARRIGAAVRVRAVLRNEELRQLAISATQEVA